MDSIQKRMTKPSLDIISPIYREEETIDSVLSALKRNVKTPYRIILVYDYENDPTLIKIKARKDKSVVLQKNKYKTGVVNAIKTGFSVATAPYVILMMADGSDNPKDIDKMVMFLSKGNDVVAASRYRKGGARKGGSRIKGILSQLACFTLAKGLGIPTTDATNAFKGFKRNVLSSISIESKGGFELPLELTVKAYEKGYTIAEIPSQWQERKGGRSKFKLLQWLPHYMRWYLYALKIKLRF